MLLLPACLEDLILQFALYRVEGYYLRSRIMSATGVVYETRLSVTKNKL